MYRNFDPYQASDPKPHDKNVSVTSVSLLPEALDTKRDPSNRSGSGKTFASCIISWEGIQATSPAATNGPPLENV